MFVAISSIEIQTIGTISMKFENLKIMTQEWFLSIFEKSGLWLASWGQKTSPGQTMHYTENFRKQKLQDVPNNVCVLINIFDPTTSRYSRVIFSYFSC